MNDVGADVNTSEESQVKVDVSAADILNPAVNVTEESDKPKAAKVADGQPTAGDLQRAAQEKQKHYDDQRAETEGVTRSSLDAGQEAVHSPEAQDELKRSQAAAKQAKAEKADERSIADKILHPGKK